MSPKKSTTGKKSKGFTAEERAAMKERVKELKSGEQDGESALLAKLATMQESKRGEVQDAVRDARLQRQGEPRRRPPVAYDLRAAGVDGR